MAVYECLELLPVGWELVVWDYWEECNSQLGSYIVDLKALKNKTYVATDNFDKSYNLLDPVCIQKSNFSCI